MSLELSSIDNNNNNKKKKKKQFQPPQLFGLVPYFQRFVLSLCPTLPSLNNTNAVDLFKSTVKQTNGNDPITSLAEVINLANVNTNTCTGITAI